MHISDFELERYYDNNSVGAIADLSPSTAETLTISELLSLDEEIRETFLNLPLEYGDHMGNNLLRGEVAATYQTLSLENIICLSGGGDSIAAILFGIIEPGDHVVVQYPAYQSLHQIPKSLGAEVGFWRMDSQNDWELDFDALKDLIRDNTRMLIINSPHNPTGKKFTLEQLKALRDLSDKHGFIIFADEIFRGMEFDPSTASPSICDVCENSISMSAMTKRFGLPGLRISWVATKRKDLQEKILVFRRYQARSNATPSELLALSALRHSEKILSRNRQIALKNKRSLENFIDVNSDFLSWTPPDAGVLSFPELAPDINAREFSENVFAKLKVFVLPSHVFGAEYNHLRIGFGNQDFLSGLEKFQEAFNWLRT